MSTERFSRQQFEAALPTDKNTNEPLWIYNGFDRGEETYVVPIKNGSVKRVAILIRSSIKADGYAADTGEDSIRMWLVNSETEKPLAKKLDAYTKRTPDWDKRMVEKIRKLYKRGLQMHNCPKCKTGVLTEKQGRYGTFYGCSNYRKNGGCRYTTNSLPQQKTQTEKTQTTESVADLLDEVLDEKETVKLQTQVQLNEQQSAYVHTDVNADIRVMAGPGSGKTTSSVERIVFLIENGIDSNNIVYTTFSKDMADEGYRRILARLPEVANTNLAKQVCTIHALCFRILMWEGFNYNVAKEWQVKKMLSEIIDDIWSSIPEKPGWKEVLLWIDNAKLNGITANDDYNFYSRYISSHNASLIHKCRVALENKMEARHLITFSDMPYKVEQLLIHNRNFRETWQGKFTHIICDEAQDTNAIALRILITLSLNPGENKVYEI